MIGSRKKLTTAQDDCRAALDLAAALRIRLAGIEREIAGELRDPPRCKHPKQPCTWDSCGPAQKRMTLEWALGVVRKSGRDGAS